MSMIRGRIENETDRLPFAPCGLQYGAVKAWSFCWNSRKAWIDVWRQSIDTVVSSQWDFHAHPRASHLVLLCVCITFPLLPDSFPSPGCFAQTTATHFFSWNISSIYFLFFCRPFCHLSAATNQGVNVTDFNEYPDLPWFILQIQKFYCMINVIQICWTWNVIMISKFFLTALHGGLIHLIGVRQHPRHLKKIWKAAAHQT